ncbi:hypothetical protein DFH06DRAFT_1336528 [Mycena polygramma]|nr:hypothetical protein DFH06DRAFT_1336528 [Mycena polygramma]
MSDFTAVTSVRDMPPEVLAKVFEYALGDFWDGFRRLPYFVARFYLAQVCVFWRVVAFSHPLLWNSYDVYSDTSPSLAQYCLERSAASHLFVRLTLGRPGPFDIESSLTPFQPHIARIRLLHLRCASVAEANTVSIALQSARPSDLRSVRFSYVGPSGDIFPVPDTASFGSEGWFINLRCLRVKKYRLNWELSGTMRHLRLLVIEDVTLPFSPTWADWLALSVASPGIERICLRNVGCGGIADNPRNIHFPSLSHLDLGFGTEPTYLCRLVAAFRSPTLITLAVSASSSCVVPYLLEDPALVLNVQRLSISFSSALLHEIHQLLDAAPNLLILDARSSDDVAMAALTTPGTGAGVVCPSLASLAVITQNTTEIRAVLEARLLASSHIDHVMFRYGFPAGHSEEDLNWLMARVGVGSKGRMMDPEWLRFSFGDDIS